MFVTAVYFGISVVATGNNEIFNTQTGIIYQANCVSICVAEIERWFRVSNFLLVLDPFVYMFHFIALIAKKAVYPFHELKHSHVRVTQQYITANKHCYEICLCRSSIVTFDAALRRLERCAQ